MFVGGVEKAGGGQFLFELFKGGGEVADAGIPHPLRIQLIHPAALIHRNPPLRHHRVPILRRKAQPLRRRPPHDAFQLRPAIFQREIEMTRTRARKIRDFAVDGYILQAKINLEQLADIPRQFRDAPGVVCRGRKREHRRIVRRAGQTRKRVAAWREGRGWNPVGVCQGVNRAGSTEPTPGVRLK